MAENCSREYILWDIFSIWFFELDTIKKIMRYVIFFLIDLLYWYESKHSLFAVCCLCVIFAVLFLEINLS